MTAPGAAGQRSVAVRLAGIGPAAMSPGARRTDPLRPPGESAVRPSQRRTRRGRAT
jgi:hypothetical protein